MNTTSTQSTPRKARPRRYSRRAPQASQPLSALSPEGLYRIRQFVPSVLGFGHSTWYDGVALGVFPPPVVKSPRLSMWSGAQVQHVAANLSTLLARLHEARREKQAQRKRPSGGLT